MKKKNGRKQKRKQQRENLNNQLLAKRVETSNRYSKEGIQVALAIMLASIPDVFGEDIYGENNEKMQQLINRTAENMEQVKKFGKNKRYANMKQIVEQEFGLNINML